MLDVFIVERYARKKNVLFMEFCHTLYIFLPLFDPDCIILWWNESWDQTNTPITWYDANVLNTLIEIHSMMYKWTILVFLIKGFWAAPKSKKHYLATVTLCYLAKGWALLIVFLFSNHLLFCFHNQFYS